MSAPCGPDGRHDAPDPAPGATTSCPCGRVTRVAAPHPQEKPRVH